MILYFALKFPRSPSKEPLLQLLMLIQIKANSYHIAS